MELNAEKPKPRSEKQREASRLNGTKSRGPVTLRGKFNSSRNSTRHGLLARSIVLENESSARFVELLSAIEDRFEPADELEQVLVENIAIARWRQSRIWEMERAGISLEMRRQLPNRPEPAPDPSTRAWIAFRSLSGSSSTLDLFNRYEARFDRQIDRTVERLNRLRNIRKAPEIEYTEISEICHTNPTTE